MIWYVNLHPWWEEAVGNFILRMNRHFSPYGFWWKAGYHFELYRCGVYGWRFDWLD